MLVFRNSFQEPAHLEQRLLVRRDIQARLAGNLVGLPHVCVKHLCGQGSQHDMLGSGALHLKMAIWLGSRNVCVKHLQLSSDSSDQACTAGSLQERLLEFWRSSNATASPHT